ncbi:MAG: glycosyltransferase [Rhizobiales bacterium]|nr:glycosyltransferase [Hyphomicrobiales bacterium]
MRLLVVTDAWRPQVNGVVRTYERLAVELPGLGVEADFITPQRYRTVPMPTYPEIRLALATPWSIAAAIKQSAPDFIHIATEGPLGLLARRWCLANGMPFTTSYHTRFPEYLAARLPVPISWGHGFERWFHNAAIGTMVATPSLAAELAAMGIERTLAWTRGVDTDLFRPRGERLFGQAGPIFLYVGRVAVEKNVEAFLGLDLPGRKVVIGDGPARAALEAGYPHALFTGPLFGEDLARHMASADVFVFPSKTDTFGIVQLEAMASGLPVAAFPVTGPRDLVVHGVTGVLGEDLQAAALAALRLDPERAREHALGFGWQACARMFIDNILSANAAVGHAPVRASRGSWATKKPGSGEPGLEGL